MNEADQWRNEAQELRKERDDLKQHLTFDRLRRINVLRCESVFHRIQDWTLSDWMTATVGELGEAANIVKKLLRLRTSPQACRPDEMDEEALKAHLASELADTAIYLDLLAAAAGVDLGSAVTEKFNATSDRLKCEVKL